MWLVEPEPGEKERHKNTLTRNDESRTIESRKGARSASHTGLYASNDQQKKLHLIKGRASDPASY